MNHNVIPFVCLLVGKGVEKKRKEWVFRYSWAGSLHGPETGWQDGSVVKCSLCQCHDPSVARSCYFLLLLNSSPWLCAWGCSPSLSSILECCLAILRMALVGADSAWCWRHLRSLLLLGPLAIQAYQKGCLGLWKILFSLGFDPTPRYPLSPLYYWQLVDLKDSTLLFHKILLRHN